MSKKIEKQPDVLSEVRRLGVFMEYVDSNVRLIAEQYGGIQNNLSELKTDVSTLKDDVIGIKGILNIHTEMIGDLAVNLEIVKSDVGFMKSSLKKKVDAEEFTMLEKRVAMLEGRFMLRNKKTTAK
ncbi:MAG: hypothetical protein AAB611_03405 [Patescibacteria group bacterium]